MRFLGCMGRKDSVKTSGFCIDGGRMEAYDNVLTFLEGRAAKVFSHYEKYDVGVTKDSVMYGKEGEYNDVYHLDGNTISVMRKFEMGKGMMNVSVFGDSSEKISNSLDKLLEVDI